MSKLKAGDVTMWATTTLMDLVGPYAWSTECPLEKFFRDAKIYQLFEGTAEIQRMVISRMQAREYAERLGYGAEVADQGDGGAEGARSGLRRRPTGPLKPLRGVRRSAHRRSILGAVHGRARVIRMRSTRGAATAGGGCGSRWRSTRRCSLAEVVGGVLTGSLAVLADAGHLLSDVGAIVLALFAARLRLAAGGGAAHLRLPALRGPGGAGQRPAPGRGRGRDRDRRGRPARRPARDRRRRRAGPRRSSAWPATSPRPWCSPAASARTSTSRGCCATASPTRSARSASSSPAPSSSPAARRSSTRSSAC